MKGDESWATNQTFLLKVIGFMAFILLIINTVFSDNRITAGRQGRATIRGKQSATNPT
jgi:hypothetical protein